MSICRLIFSSELVATKDVQLWCFKIGSGEWIAFHMYKTYVQNSLPYVQNERKWLRWLLLPSAGAIAGTSLSFAFSITRNNHLTSTSSSRITFITISEFWCFTKFFFQQEWNDAWLLLINMVYTSCLTSSQTTQYWGSQEIRKYQESVLLPK